MTKYPLAGGQLSGLGYWIECLAQAIAARQAWIDQATRPFTNSKSLGDLEQTIGFSVISLTVEHS